MIPLADKRVLLIGAGGLGSPVAALLARAGVGYLEVVDQDRIELSNLHRQTLYRREDVGEPKSVVAAARIEAEARAAGHARTRGVAREMRVYPADVLDVIRGFDLVVEGADNYATKFMIADACALRGIASVQAGAVRWVGWAFGNRPGASACLRCVFEDVPEGPDRGCSVAGVLGPVVGVVGALQASIALSLLAGRAHAAGVLHHYRALRGGVRRARVGRREACPLCSGQIRDIDAARYLPRDCAA
jgi:molybdopterin/thiamine biosynthesis adenylyltransferase